MGDMNYDVYLLPLEATDNYASIIKRLDKTGEPDSDDFVATVDVRLSAYLLRKLDSRYEPFVFGYEEIARAMKISAAKGKAKSSLREHIEMNGPMSRRPRLAQFLFYRNYVLVHYHSGTTEEEMGKYCTAICRNAGLSIFDAQLETIYRLNEKR